MPLPQARKGPFWGLSLPGGRVTKGWLLGGARLPNSALLVYLAADYCALVCAKLCAGADKNPCLCPPGAGASYTTHWASLSLPLIRGDPTDRLK